MKDIAPISLVVLMILAIGIDADVEPFEGRVLLDRGSIPINRAQVVFYDVDHPDTKVSTTTDEEGYFTLSVNDVVLPGSNALGQNYPNPFNPSTLIPFEISQGGHVRLDVFNLLGQRVVRLIDEDRPAGPHKAHWNGTDAQGRSVAAGIYIFRLSTRDWHQARRLVLIDGPAGNPGSRSGDVMPRKIPRYQVEISGENIVPATFTWSPGMGALVAEVETVKETNPLGIEHFERAGNPFAGISLESVIEVVSMYSD